MVVAVVVEGILVFKDTITFIRPSWHMSLAAIDDDDNDDDSSSGSSSSSSSGDYLNGYNRFTYNDIL